MDTLVLSAQPRQLTEKAKHIRSKGLVPAVYYGKGQKNQHVSLNYQQFRKVFASAGENTIIELSVEGKKIPVLVYSIQTDPVSDAISHVDFIHVDMEKEVTTSVKVTFTGIAPAVKNLGGILDVHKHEIKIKCLPKDLIHGIEVDLSPIVDFHTSIHVKDLKVPATIKILDNPEDTVVTATHIKIEEEKPATAEVPGAGATAEGSAPVAGAPAGGTAQAVAPAGKKEAKK